MEDTYLQSPIKYEFIEYDFNLSLDMVQYNYHYKLSKASIGQIMVSFSNIKNLKPTNIYQQILYQHFYNIIPQFVECYTKLFDCDNIIEKNIKFYHLIVNLPYKTEINIINSNDKNNHSNIILGKPKIGELIKASKQRIDYIIDKPIPEIYKYHNEYVLEYDKFIDQIKNFKDDLLNFEQEFVDAIDDAYQQTSKYYSKYK